MTSGETNGGAASDLQILLLSVTSGPKTKEIVRQMTRDPTKWMGWAQNWPPHRLKVVGMYELIGNWDLAILFRTNAEDRDIVNATFRREILIRAHEGPFPPVHASGGQFGRFHAISVRLERGTLSGAAPIRRMVLPSSEAYEDQGVVRAFIVLDASPTDERGAATPSMETVLAEMQEAVGPESAGESIECVYVSRHAAVVEMLSRRPGAADLTKFNRLIEPGLAEHAIQKYSLLCYGYDEVVYGWG